MNNVEKIATEIKRVSFVSFSLRSKKMKAIVGSRTDGLDCKDPPLIRPIGHLLPHGEGIY